MQISFWKTWRLHTWLGNVIYLYRSFSIKQGKLRVRTITTTYKLVTDKNSPLPLSHWMNSSYLAAHNHFLLSKDKVRRYNIQDTLNTCIYSRNIRCKYKPLLCCAVSLIMTIMNVLSRACLNVTRLICIGSIGSVHALDAAVFCISSPGSQRMGLLWPYTYRSSERLRWLVNTMFHK